jgi:tetratricopeptide (TPR) repeat protein
VISTLAWTLRPRWGGSYTTLERLAASVRKAGDVERNRLAGFIEGLIFYDQGDLALARKEYDTALGLFARAVELSDHPTFRIGQGRAMFALGQAVKVRGLLESQLEASPHYTELLLWLAHTSFALMDNDQGVAYLRRAVRLGNTKAVALLGHALTYGGRGQNRDLVAGMRLLELSGHYYDASMLFNLGKLHELGQGVPVDHAKAVAYYERASALGDLPASNDLGIMLWNGRGTPSDKPRAARLWHAAAAAGIWQAETNLNYFLSPMERIRLALELGVGWWLVKPVLGFASVLFGLGYLLYAARRRRRLRSATTTLFDELGLAETVHRSGSGDPSDGWRAAARFILIGGAAAVVAAYLAVHLVRDFLPALAPYLDLFREHFVAIVAVCTLLAVLIWQRGRRRSYAHGDNPFRIAYSHLVNGRQRHAIAYLLSVPGTYPEAAGVAQLVGRLRTK